MTAAATYRIHGLSWRSEVPLEAKSIASQGEPSESPDVELLLGSVRPVPAASSDHETREELVAVTELGGTRLSTTIQTACGYRFRYHGLADVTADRGLTRLVVHRDPSADPRMVAIVVSSTVTAAVATLRGYCVLHASAVEHQGRAVAFVGAPGQGKSTVAALACAAGARLVTDDALRVETGESLVRCLGGTVSLRLRPLAAVLAARIAGAETSPTADGRLMVRPPEARSRCWPLAGIVVPTPDRATGRLRFERMSAAQALGLLLAHPRMSGLRQREALTRHLRVCAVAARSVPVMAMHVPWGPPWRPDVGEELLGLAHLCASSPVGKRE